MIRSHRSALLFALSLVACGDDAALPEESRDTDEDTSAVPTSSTGAESGTTTSISGTEGTIETDSGGSAMAFLVTIENLSGRTALPTPLSPGVWATHDANATMFVLGDAATAGIESLAEDGSPTMLADELRGRDGIAFSGVFDTPRGSGVASPALPSDTYDFTITASPDEPRLSFVSMIAQSNDTFVATPFEGVALFDAHGDPIEAMDITDRMQLWDAGTEANEAPAMGRNQAPRQLGTNVGPGEDGVYPFTHETRGLPLGRAIADVTIEESDGEFTITFANISYQRGAVVTPLSPVFFAVHDESFAMFDTDGPARDGLEALAEDGDPSQMVAAHASAPGVLTAGMVDTPLDAATAGPAAPGEMFEIVVTPDADHRLLSFASMVAETNDVFLAVPPEGVALVDDNGNARDPESIAEEIRRTITAWDAGTEQNQVPGVGFDQAPRQDAPDAGLPDEIANVRRYGDSRNDLAGQMLGGFMDLQIHDMGDGSFEVTVRNTSDETAYPGLLSPLVWLLHNEAVSLFREGQRATTGVEALAEDGDPMVLLGELESADGVMMAGMVATPTGSKQSRPLWPGEAYVFTVTPSGGDRYFDFASMVVPSNDTFAALGNGGIALLRETGEPRSDGELSLEIASRLRAWDAGTEANQASAAGRDQAPYQSGPDVGPSQGNHTIHRAESEPVWVYPSPSESIRVTIQAMR